MRWLIISLNMCLLMFGRYVSLRVTEKVGFSELIAKKKIQSKQTVSRFAYMLILKGRMDGLGRWVTGQNKFLVCHIFVWVNVDYKKHYYRGNINL